VGHHLHSRSPWVPTLSTEGRVQGWDQVQGWVLKDLEYKEPNLVLDVQLKGGIINIASGV
jgi:hypothetical protein